ncbi:MAG: sulfatase-like hydrolase/transferase [Bacteroidales bacterium]|nr:sulfatase-like hydrolase/transferase [Bacteroidales bacterium]
MKKATPCKSQFSHLYYLLSVYVVGIVAFALFRCINTLVFWLKADQTGWGFDLARAFFMGWRFDTVISCYILALPLLYLFVIKLIGIKRRGFYLGAHIFIMVLYLVSFFACAADIPYFNYFFTRLNVSALAWMDSPAFVVKMIVEESRFLLYLAVFLIFAVAYVLVMRRLYRKFLKESGGNVQYFKQIVVGLLLVGICLLGMRGRIALKSPIRVGTAYFCNDAFLNQLGLNPMFTFFNSIKESRKNKDVNLIDPATAERVYLAQMSDSTFGDSALLQLPPNTNVVVVMMESMAACRVTHFNPAAPPTPSLDSIAAHGLSFENAYSAGIHTYNGIYSTLFSFPAVLDHHSMKKTDIPVMCGMPHHFKAHGYYTMYFTTHDDQFDNVAGFLYANDIEQVVSQKDYPADEVKSTLGVPDHVLFRHVVEELDKANDKPFFAAVMTASYHNPYVLPDDIGWKPQSESMDDKMVEYADWSIGEFMRMAKERPWFENTLFVFVADHGVSGNSPYDMSLKYHHVPMLFYCPSQIPPQTRSQLALQIDIGPTVLGMLFPDDDNSTFGLDLQRQRRQYAFFSADDKIGVLDTAHFYRYRVADANEALYFYRTEDVENHIDAERPQADAMREYGFGMIQHAFDRLKNKKTSCR